jgi:hypothetical protein
MRWNNLNIVAPKPNHIPCELTSSVAELLIRMLIVGYSFGIRSERRLCEEVHLNLAYGWPGRCNAVSAIR